MTLFALGDVLGQTIEGKDKFDPKRTGRLAAWGFGFGLAAHPWYLALSRMVTATGTRGVAMKVFLDQTVWTLPINIAFLYSTSMMEHGDHARSLQNAKNKLWPVLRVNWVVWPVLQAVNFAFVPVQFQVLFVNVCVIFWSAFLSVMQSDSGDDGQAEQTADSKGEQSEGGGVRASSPVLASGLEAAETGVELGGSTGGRRRAQFPALEDVGVQCTAVKGGADAAMDPGAEGRL